MLKRVHQMGPIFPTSPLLDIHEGVAGQEVAEVGAESGYF